MTLPITAEGQSVDFVADLVVLRVGRATSSLAFYNVFEPFDEDLKIEIATIAAAKLPTE